MGYLTGTAEAGKMDIGFLMARVIRQGGPGGYGQVRRLFQFRLRRSGINLDEFYNFGLWRDDFARSFLPELVTNSQRKAFNAALEVPSAGLATQVIEDKVATEVILRQRGLPCSLTRAAHAAAPLAGHIPHLADVAAVAAFLRNPDNLPVFGKPRSDSYARGAVAITGLTADGQSVVFLDGKTAPVAALAAEIAESYGSGYLFQPFYQCHADLRRHVGPAMASVRIVTLLTDRGVEPYYAVLRVPSKTAMHDGDARGSRIWGVIDLASGAVVNLRALGDPLAAAPVHLLNPVVPLLGQVMPHWPQAMAAVLAAHDSFPAHGMLGWDVFLTDSGALVNEVNANPGHVYQAAAGRGLRNPDLEPLYARALAHARARNRAARG